MISKNEQSAVSLGTAAGMFIGFGPMIAEFNENVGRIFSIFYTRNFIYYGFYTDDIARRIMVILVNIAVLMLIFTWVYSKRKLRV